MTRLPSDKFEAYCGDCSYPFFQHLLVALAEGSDTACNCGQRATVIGPR